MKRQALEAVIDGHVHSMKKHSGKIPGAFAPEDVHDLRVSYKKLRALARLLQAKALPKDFRSLYRAAGKVRDLQLFIQHFPITAPCFIEQCQRDLFHNKEQLVRAIEHTTFKSPLKYVPNQLSRTIIEKFITQRVATVQLITAVADEENDLHEARKQVKDIIYVQKLSEADDQTYTNLATELGNFNDRCHALALLTRARALPAEEKQAIAQLQQTWATDKQVQQQQLLIQLQQFYNDRA